MTARFTKTVLVPAIFIFLGACASVPRGRTSAIHIAVDEGNISALMEILSSDNKVDARDEMGRSALHHAAAAGDILAAAALLDAGADPNLKDVEGRVPLHYAVLVCSPDMAAMLLGAGSDASIVDKNNITPSALATERDCVEVRQTIESSM